MLWIQETRTQTQTYIISVCIMLLCMLWYSGFQSSPNNNDTTQFSKWNVTALQDHKNKPLHVHKSYSYTQANIINSNGYAYRVLRNKGNVTHAEHKSDTPCFTSHNSSEHNYYTCILYQNLSSHYGLHQTCTKLCHWWARTIDRLEQFTCCYLHLIFTLGLFYTFTSWHINAFTFDQWSVSVERIVSTPVWPFPCKLEFLPKHQNKLQSIASIASPIVKVTNKAKAISYNAKGYNSRPKYSL